jgi:hypothetical protein
MKAKSSLPWKVAPKAPEMVAVGHADYGVLEIPKLGALKINEAVFIQDETKDCPSMINISTALAKDISEKENLPTDEVLAILLGGGDREVAQRLTLYFVEFQERVATIKPRRNPVLATAMLRRIMGDGWSIVQTSEEIPPKLIEDLAGFCSKEMNGWVEEIEVAENDSEESVVDQVKND